MAYTTFIGIFFIYMFACLHLQNDFMTFYSIGLLALKHQDIYLPSPITKMYVFYLPYFPLLMIPFSILPLKVAAILWSTIKGFLYVVFGKIQKTFKDIKKNKYFIFFTLLPFIILISPINNDFKLGQVDAYISIFLALTFYFEQKKQSFISSIFYVLACVKVIPLIVFLWFILTKRVKFILYTSLIAVMVAIIHISYFGWGYELEMIRHYLSIVHTQKLDPVALRGISNQGFFGIFGRIGFLINGSHYAPTVVVKYVRLAWITISAITTLIVGYLTVKYPQKNCQLFTYSMFIVLMLLVSPDTSSAHLVMLLMPIMALCQTKAIINRQTVPLYLFYFFALSFEKHGSYYLMLPFFAMLSLIALLFYVIKHNKTLLQHGA